MAQAAQDETSGFIPSISGSIVSLFSKEYNNNGTTTFKYNDFVHPFPIDQSKADSTDNSKEQDMNTGQQIFESLKSFIASFYCYKLIANEYAKTEKQPKNDNDENNDESGKFDDLGMILIKYPHSSEQLLKSIKLCKFGKAASNNNNETIDNKGIDIFNMVYFNHKQSLSYCEHLISHLNLTDTALETFYNLLNMQGRYIPVCLQTSSTLGNYAIKIEATEHLPNGKIFLDNIDKTKLSDCNMITVSLKYKLMYAVAHLTKDQIKANDDHIIEIYNEKDSNNNNGNNDNNNNGDILAQKPKSQRKRQSVSNPPKFFTFDDYVEEDNKEEETDDTKSKKSGHSRNITVNGWLRAKK